MDASGADKLILLVQTNPVLCDKSAAGYKIFGGRSGGGTKRLTNLIEYVSSPSDCKGLHRLNIYWTALTFIVLSALASMVGLVCIL